MRRRPTRDLDDLLRHATNPLAADDERRCIVAAQGGDRESMGRLVTSNLPWIARLATRVRNRGLAIPLEDAVQEGVIGLMRAVRAFDIDTGNRLNTIATKAVFWSIWRANSDYMRIRLNCEWMQPKWAGRKCPELRERANIALGCGLDSEVVMPDGTSIMSLVVGELDPEVEAMEAREEARIRIGAWLPRLNDRDREAVELKHFEGKSFVEIGTWFGVSKQRAAQMEARGMELLRDMAGARPTGHRRRKKAHE